MTSERFLEIICNPHPASVIPASLSVIPAKAGIHVSLQPKRFGSTPQRFDVIECYGVKFERVATQANDVTGQIVRPPEHDPQLTLANADTAREDSVWPAHRFL